MDVACVSILSFVVCCSLVILVGVQVWGWRFAWVGGVCGFVVATLALLCVVCRFGFGWCCWVCWLGVCYMRREFGSAGLLTIWVAVRCIVALVRWFCWVFGCWVLWMIWVSAGGIVVWYLVLWVCYNISFVSLGWLGCYICVGYCGLGIWCGFWVFWVLRVFGGGALWLFMVRAAGGWFCGLGFVV